MKAKKEVLCKEHEEGVLLKGLERLVTKISGQNIDNMNQYTENIPTLVSSIKENIVKDGVTNTSASSVLETRVTKLTKLIKVLIWSRNMTLETFVKQLETWLELNEEIP